MAKADRRVSVTDLKTCKRCGVGSLSWETSRRNGKPYLCIVRRTREGLYAMPYQPHKCHPDDVARMDAARAQDEANGIHFEF